MALIAFPDEAWVTSIGLTLQRPGQTTLETPGGIEVYDVTEGRFFAEVTLGNVPQSETRRVAAFIESLNGAEHWFELPVYEDPTITGSPTISATVAAASSPYPYAVAFSASAASFKTGDIFRVQNRCYRVLRPQAGARNAAVNPNPHWTGSQSVVYKDVKMVLRQREEAPMSYREARNFGGPWTLFCEEVI